MQRHRSAVILSRRLEVLPTFVVISVLARLQTIPDHLYEAATMDGAGARAASSTSPAAAARGAVHRDPSARHLGLQEFDLIYLLTGDGPGDGDPDAAAARLQAGAFAR